MVWASCLVREDKWAFCGLQDLSACTILSTTDVINTQMALHRKGSPTLAPLERKLEKTKISVS